MQDKNICKYSLILTGQPKAASSVCKCALTAAEHSKTAPPRRGQGCQICFFKKGQGLSQKGQKRPTKLLKKANTQLKTVQNEPNLSFDESKFNEQFASSQFKFTLKYILCIHSASKKAVNSITFLELVTYGSKCQSFSFSKTPK